MGRTLIGLDLDRENAQISFYNERSMEPETVSIPDNGNRYLIPVPADLFSLIEGSVELGLMALANFLKTCIGYIRPAVNPRDACLMVTMREIDLTWADALRAACQMIGMEPDNLFLQTHRESFCCYTLNQRKDLWLQKTALFEYEQGRIHANVMSIDYGTKPALVKAEEGKTLDFGTKGTRSDAQWNERRDKLFLEMIQNTFQDDAFSCVYLIGDCFDKSWAVESLQFLCRRRHVFQGRNLYTKGACYGAMQRMGAGKKLDQYLYYSEDMVDTNLSMRMTMRGKTGSYSLINAGVNWFEAEHSCEFLTDGEKEVVIYGKSMLGGEADKYSIVLKDLPQREGRTVRLLLHARFIARRRCKITIRDLGFGEIYPASGIVWESVLEV